MRRNELKKRLYAGESVLGLFSTVDSMELIEIAGLCGFDFTVIDCEHGAFSIESVRKLIPAAELRGMTPLMRITDKLPSTILRSLDIGTYGILAPDVESAEEAKRIVKSAKYYPMGQRGMAIPRAGDYGLMTEDYHSFANENTLIAVQCESKAGMDHLEEISAVEGIDVIFIGPFDLSQSLGVPGQIESQTVKDAIQTSLVKIRSAGKIAGIYAVDAGQAKQYIDMGFCFVLVSQDTDYFSQACRKMLEEIRAK